MSEELASLTHGQVLGLAAYFAVLLALSTVAVHRWMLVARVLWRPARRRAPPPAGGSASPIPAMVTVQLPLYNEANVASRLLRAVAAFDYPRDRLEIQVLDDSTDETRDVVDAEAAALRRRGFLVEVLRRPDRTGYKAGALAHGLQHARGDLLAIFDADFVPPPGFLAALLPELNDPGVGMVQARWGHMNRDTSLLTQVQGLALDGHFLVEHEARHRSGLFFNFNGTAGIWRRQAILDAGGWRADTVTEDLDLSYRAQLAGWRFVYRDDVVAEAELPDTMAALVSQQQRWTRGAAQTLRMLAPRLLRAPVSRAIRLEGLLHLSSGIAYPLLFLLSLVTLPALVVRWQLLGMRGLTVFLTLADLLILVVATGAVVAFYAVSQRRQGRGWWESCRSIPALIGLGMGLSPSNAWAWLGGFLRGGGEFVRTPKAGAAGAAAPSRRAYFPRGTVRVAVMGITMAVIYLWAGWNCLSLGLWSPLPFVALYLWGFLYVGVESLVVPRGVVRGSTADQPPLDHRGDEPDALGRDLRPEGDLLMLGETAPKRHPCPDGNATYGPVASP